MRNVLPHPYRRGGLHGNFSARLSKEFGSQTSVECRNGLFAIYDQDRFSFIIKINGLFTTNCSLGEKRHFPDTFVRIEICCAAIPFYGAFVLRSLGSMMEINVRFGCIHKSGCFYTRCARNIQRTIFGIRKTGYKNARLRNLRLRILFVFYLRGFLVVLSCIF